MPVWHLSYVKLYMDFPIRLHHGRKKKSKRKRKLYSEKVVEGITSIQTQLVSNVHLVFILRISVDCILKFIIFSTTSPSMISSKNKSMSNRRQVLLCYCAFKETLLTGIVVEQNKRSFPSYSE